MLPLSFLAGMLTLTLVALVAHLVVRRRAGAHLRRLAARWKMQYAQTDRFQLTARVAERFPVPGASDLALIDLIYTQEADRYRYLFTVQYTEGVVRTKNRVARVGTLCEPRDRSISQRHYPLLLAPADLPWLLQYAHLLESSDDAKPI